jgi:hypothetical protein
VKKTGTTRLLGSALANATGTDLTPDEAIGDAARSHQRADDARAAKLRARPQDPLDQPAEAPGVVLVERSLVDAALTALRSLVAAVLTGERLHEHDVSSLRLLTDQLTP